MRMIKKGFLTVILTLLTLVMLAFGVACQPDPPKVTVTFNTNGVSSVEATEVELGASYDLPVPSQEGYEFQGWYTNAELTGEPVTKLEGAASDVTYYAKWEQLYLLTLNADGGELSTASVYVKAGEIVHNYVKDLAPVKPGYEFGAWFNGNKELSKNLKMPAEGLTLTAKYKAPYTVEIWKQALNEDGTLGEYVKETQTAYEYVGKKVSLDLKVEGFKQAQNDNAVVEITVSENTADNVLKYYYNRAQYRVTFNVVYPDGTKAENAESVTAYYGAEIEIPTGYEYDGYCLIGWSFTENGEVAYDSKYIENALYGATYEAATMTVPERDSALYSVWYQAYTDMFMNSDYVYLFETEVENEDGETETEYSIYLSRGGVLFKGEYREKTQKFYFVDNNDNIILQGQLYENHKYIYSDPSRKDIAYTEFKPGQGLLQAKLYLGEYNDIVYSVTKDKTSYEVKGTYFIDEYGYYTATFTEGAFGEVFGDATLTEKTLTMMLGFVQTNSGYEAAFQLRNDEEYDLGPLYYFGIYEGNVSYAPSVYQIILDGFGNAYRFNGESFDSFLYTYDAKTKLLTLKNANGQAAGVVMVMEQTFNNEVMNGYAIYDENMKGEFSVNGIKLTLDGTFNATYEDKEGTSYKGYYTTTASVLGGTLVSFTSGATKYNFMITRIEEQFNLGDQLITTVRYEVAEKSLNYAEYYYQSADGKLAPILAVNDPADGEAILYGYTVVGTFVELSRGTFVYDEVTELYTYTADPDSIKEPEEELNTKIMAAELAGIQKMVCALDTSVTSYAIHYWYSFDMGEGDCVTFDKAYTSSMDDGATLVLVSGIAIYEKDGAIITGVYKTNEKTGVTTIQNVNGQVVYVKLDEENAKFATLQHAPYNAYLLDKDGNTISRNEYLAMDGLGGVTYNVVTKGEGENAENVTTTYVGTMEQTGELTDQFMYVYKFTAAATEETEAVEFTFILVPYSTSYLFAKQNDAYKTAYSSKEYGELKLDGFGYQATYKDTKGNEYTDKYFIEEENLVSLVVEGITRYFELNENGSFVLLGTEYTGDTFYFYIKNQYIENLYLNMDGKGNLTVYKMVEDAEGESVRQDIDTEGTYVIEGDVITLTYVEEGVTKTVKGQFEVYGNYLVFAEMDNTGIAQTYVNPKDNTVLILDEVGNAIKYTEKGYRDVGYYTLITDSMLYYVNESGTDACLYTYNTATGQATIMKLNPRGYYTKDLESLIFTEYGFAIFNGDTRYYYSIDAENNATIYIEAETGEAHNGYGFKAISFGAFDNVVTWGEGEKEKTYYATDGYSIKFNRTADNAEKYPFEEKQISALSFAPSGNGEFTVAATMIMDGKNATCYVTRDVKEDGSVETYITYGLYRFAIALSYEGDGENGENNNTFEINSMQMYLELPASNFCYIQYIYYMFGGAELANTLKNTVGSIQVISEYSEEGVASAPYLNISFGEDSDNYNTNNELLSAIKLPIYDMEGNQLEDMGAMKVGGETIYVVHFESAGYTYHLYFVPAPAYIGGYMFYTQALTREETFTKDGYTLTFETIVSTDASGLKKGQAYYAELSYTEGETTTVIEATSWYMKDGYFYYMVREIDEVTGLYKENAVFYKIRLVEKKGSLVGELEIVEGDGETGTDYEDGETGTEGEETPKEEDKFVPLYDTEAFKVEKLDVMTIYASNKQEFVDINKETNEVYILAVEGRAYIVMESSYDEATGVYTVKLSSTIAYEVKIVEGEDGSKTITVTEKVITEETEGSENAA